MRFSTYYQGSGFAYRFTHLGIQVWAESDATWMADYDDYGTEFKGAFLLKYPEGMDPQAIARVVDFVGGIAFQDTQDRVWYRTLHRNKDDYGKLESAPWRCLAVFLHSAVPAY